MECSCGGVLIDKKAVYRVAEQQFTFILENVPAFECTRCGKVLYTDETAEKIQKLVNTIRRDSREIVTGRPSAKLYEY
jgi:YgiT-type zinc finger domain-containing protein